MTLRVLEFHRSLHRPNLFLGGEREPVMLAVLLAVGIIMSGINLVAFAAGGVILIAFLPLFRAMAKSDPMMIKVWTRHRTYRGYYAPRSRACVGDTMSAGRQWAYIAGGGAVIVALLLLHYGAV